ncbi:MAG: GNAT family N-acetyltransferase [Candidatus Sericytochromatia bacterium]|nr:GNAT family N-acetyltransferase [Candidatus Sericytochromatia bacterium]
MAIKMSADSPVERRLARAWLEEAAALSYPDLATLGRITRAERLDALFETHWHHPERRLWFAWQADGPPIGLVWLQASHHGVTDLPDWVVVCLAVSMAHRGRGTGKALMLHARAEAARAGVPRLRLYVASDNAPARRLYASLGYEPGVIELSSATGAG